MTDVFAQYGGRLRDLSTDECMELMGLHSVGRVAYASEDGPVVVPMNYVVQDGTILIRTSARTTLAAHLMHGPASFEIDEIDDFTQSGWSVLVRGAAEAVEDPATLPDDLADRPQPWAEGTRSLFVRITPRSVTGRQLYPS